MVVMRDVWINWFEGEDNSYNVCDFVEWRPSDRVEVLDQVVLIKVTHRLMDYLENEIAELPERLLQDVYQKSYLRKNMSRIQLDYCFIATDGHRILAVDTAGFHTPIKKSRLTPRQQQLVHEHLSNGEWKEYDSEKDWVQKEYHILSPAPEEMIGLTRKERQLKVLLHMVLDELKQSGTDAEVRYWFTEWKPESYGAIQCLNREEAWQQFYQEVQSGWTSQHYELCETMIKGQPFFEKLWEQEHPESVK
ncbi:YjbA family protein [Alkalicoccobacillus porphyridii]|uniref:DUF3603 family protein n=1 Tax=Alkalicoccobacillus porphyridii TaxID=2597270 RepID=A0A553ZXE9_9BACI|nr:YjbA family protein [Alkalicoccobacillus porphyridii]TSB46114.1 DUF3603 family protein [Alkalicoccobacillus porphyridii]